MSRWSRSVSSTICSFVSISSARGTVSGSSSRRSEIGITWHIEKSPMNTSSLRWFASSMKSRRLEPWNALKCSSAVYPAAVSTSVTPRLPPCFVDTSMSPTFRGSSGFSSGAWRWTATPPRTRIRTPRSLAVSTSRFDSSTGFSSGRRLPRGEEEVEVVTVRVEIYDDAAQDVRRILAARVEAHRPADLLGALRLVDVPVQPDHRVVLLDHVADRLAADRDDARPAAADDRHEGLVELGRVVEA